MGKILPPLIVLKVFGALGIFTNPVNKVDRTSYPVMTPSAARGLLGSIYAKPEMHWEVHRIEVLNPIRFLTMQSNEFKSFRPPKDGGPIFAVPSPKGRRTQRFSTFLFEPAYIIHAALVCHNPTRAEQDKHWAIANRRIDRGQHYYQPCFGRKTCFAHFERPSGEEPREPLTLDLGRMFFDRSYGEPNRPLWFDAKLVDGVLEVPTEMYEQVRFAGRAS